MIFEHGQLEEFLALVKNFNTAINGTGTTSAAGKINDISTILCGEQHREFDKLASQNNGTINAHLNFILEGLLGFFD